MLPVLKLFEDGQQHSMKEVRLRVAEQMGLTPEQLAEMTAGGKQGVYENRIGWAKWHLTKARALRTVSRGVYVIDARGRELLAEKPRAIDLKMLTRWPDFAELVLASRTASTAGIALKANDQPRPEASDLQTPEELLEDAYRGLRRTTEQDLLEALKSCSPAFFEKVVIDVLLRMGYGGSRADAGMALGRSGDGGVDGVINEDRLGLDVVYVQAKRWEDNVGRPVVQAFAGSLEGFRARKGVLITTSGFAAPARDYVERIDKRIVLIDGPRLAALMFELGVGVTAKAVYEVKAVDSDYFEEE